MRRAKVEVGRGGKEPECQSQTRDSNGGRRVTRCKARTNAGMGKKAKRGTDDKMDNGLANVPQKCALTWCSGGQLLCCLVCLRSGRMGFQWEKGEEGTNERLVRAGGNWENGRRLFFALFCLDGWFHRGARPEVGHSCLSENCQPIRMGKWW